MVNRIKNIISEKKLSPTQFADAIEVQRSSLSHVLSGRNKPSLDFMIKIKNSFPEINLDWLLMGEGNMHIQTDEKIPDPSNQVNTEFDFAGSNPVIEEESFEKRELKNPKNNLKSGIDTSESKKPVKIIMLYSDNTFETFNVNS